MRPRRRRYLLGEPEERVARELGERVGPTTKLLSDVCGVSEGGVVKFNVRSDETKLEIFRMYPEVRAAYDDLVPARLAERDFWIKLFQSEHYHQDKAAGRGERAR